MTTNNHKKGDRRKSWLVPTSSLFNTIFYPKQHRSTIKKERSKSLDHGTLKKINETDHFLTLTPTQQPANSTKIDRSPSTPVCTKKMNDKNNNKKFSNKKSSSSPSMIPRKTPKIVEMLFSKAKKHPKLKRAATLFEIKAQHYMKSKEDIRGNGDNDDNNTINNSPSFHHTLNNNYNDDDDSAIYQPYITKVTEEDLDKFQQENDLFKLAFADELTRPFNEDTIEKVLDIGCGPNLPWCIDFAKAHPNAHVIGMDLFDMVEGLMDVPKNCELLKHNCIRPFPMEDNSIDLCHIRFMNTALTMDQYKKVVENCWRVLKPGGHIEIMEMDTLVYSTGPVTELLNQQVMDKIRQLGFKPRLAKVLKETLPSDPKLTDQHITEFYRSLPIGVWGGRLGVLFRDDLVYALTYARHFPFFGQRSPSYTNVATSPRPLHPHSISDQDGIHTPPSITTITTDHHYTNNNETSLSSSTTTTPTNSIIIDHHLSSQIDEDEGMSFENQLLVAEKELEQCRSFSNFHFLRAQKPY